MYIRVMGKSLANINFCSGYMNDRVFWKRFYVYFFPHPFFEGTLSFTIVIFGYAWLGWFGECKKAKVFYTP